MHHDHDFRKKIGILISVRGARWTHYTESALTFHALLTPISLFRIRTFFFDISKAENFIEYYCNIENHHHPLRALAIPIDAMILYRQQLLNRLC